MLALHLAQEFTLRAFLGELGDKTFLLTGILVAWCPWDGVRSNEKARYQQLLVFLAAVLALYVRTLLISAKTVKPSSETSNCVYEWMTFAFILVLIPKACAELRRTEAENAMRERLNERAEARAGRGSQLSPKMGGGFFMGASGAPFARADTEEAAEEQHQQPPRSPGRADYGSTGSPKNCSAAFPANFRDTLASNILAFFVPLVVIFCAEAEDKSEAAVMAGGGPKNKSDVVGVMLGIPLALLLAAFIGFVMERQVSDNRLNFAAVLVLSILCLVSLSQALMHIDAAVAQTPTGAAAAHLLQIVPGEYGNFSWPWSS